MNREEFDAFKFGHSKAKHQPSEVGAPANIEADFNDFETDLLGEFDQADDESHGTEPLGSGQSRAVQ